MTTLPVMQKHFIQRRKWGLTFAGVYLLVCIPCAAAYMFDGHEYSIPLLIVYFASVPTHFLLYEILRPVTRAIENLPYGMALGLWIWVGLTALLYFAFGQVVGRIVCVISRRKIHLD